MKKIFIFLLLTLASQIYSQDSTNVINQYGITWTFDKKYRYGQFVNGDYWVVGPVTINSINPASVVVPAQNNRVINGSMINPAINLLQGYDSRMLGTEGKCWDATLNVARPNGTGLSASNPLKINNPSSLLSSISRETPEDAKNVLTIAVLTILDKVPPVNAFRPPFVGSNNKSIVHTQSDIKRGVLPKLNKPSSLTLTVDKVTAYFEKPWVEHMKDWQKEIFCPVNNMQAYGRDIASNVSDGALMLTLNIDSTAKELLLIRMIQLGLDCFGMIQSPSGSVAWKADGGHMSGRAFPMIFAGYMLDDKAITDVMKKSGLYAYQNGYYEGKLPADYIHFGEIDQTFYVTQRDVDRTHLPNWSPDNRGNTPTPYEVSDIGLAEWGINHVHSPMGDNKAWGATYRAVCTPGWCGFLLASRILGIANLWNHPPLFDYVKRWVSTGEEAGLTDLQKLMWAAYNGNYPITTSIETINVPGINLVNYPNPFKSETTIEYTISGNENIVISVYDFTGRLITTLVNEKKEAGTHKTVFNADKFGCKSGIYFFDVKNENTHTIAKSVLIE